MRLALKIVLILCAFQLSGCQTTLPNVSRMQEERTANQPVTVGPKGELHPSKSREVLAKLRQKAGSTDLIQANISLMQSLGGLPLTAGNQGPLAMLYPGA